MNLSCLSEIYFYQLKPYLSFACQGDLSVEPWFIAAEFYRVCGYFNRPDSLRFLRATNLIYATTQRSLPQNQAKP